MQTATWEYTNVNNKLEYMLEKIVSIQTGLLRFKDRDGRVALKVKAIQPAHPTSMQLFLTENVYQEKLMNYPASFTQKCDNGYLYVTGFISALKINNAYLMTMKIMKAHWFESKGSGVNKWLEEVCMYDQQVDEVNN
jgi:hypothetical protein